MTEIDLTHIAALARLSFSETQREALAADMTALLALAHRICAEEELPPPTDREAARLRDDEPSESLSREALLAAAPRCRDGYITVPLTVEEVDHG